MQFIYLQINVRIIYLMNQRSLIKEIQYNNYLEFNQYNLIKIYLMQIDVFLCIIKNIYFKNIKLIIIIIINI